MGIGTGMQLQPLVPVRTLAHKAAPPLSPPVHPRASKPFLGRANRTAADSAEDASLGRRPTGGVEAAVPWRGQLDNSLGTTPLLTMADRRQQL